MKMQLHQFPLLVNTSNGIRKAFRSSTLKFIAILLFGFFGKQVSAQTLLNETFSNLTAVDYATSITTANFDVSGWTQSGTKITVAEAGSVCIGKSGTSGSDLTTPVLDLSGTDIVILSFKLKYYGTNPITASTSVKTIVTLDGSNVFVTSKGVVTLPTGLPNYDNATWTTYSIILTGGTASSTITFKGTSSNYAYMIDDVVVTKAPLPTVTTTTPPSTINFTSTTLGANITATGLPITESGIVWSASNTNPTTADTKILTSPLATSGAYAVTLSGLTAGNTYYYNSYVVTPAGTVYGTAASFTTPIPDYKLISTTGSLDFGGVTINTPSILSYTVSGKNLEPASGNITVTAPAGFTISLSSGGTYGSTLSLPYSANTLAATTIYVKYTPTAAFEQPSGIITLSGGGVTSDYIVNEKVTGRGKLVDPTVTSNAGNDFWLGFGYHTSMKSSNGASLSVYVSSPDKDATVIVEMPGLGSNFTTQTIFVPKGTVQEVSGFPTADNDVNASNFPDSRLYYTGISNRAIHVYSQDGTPISVWMYTYSSDNSAAGSMIFPTNTWNTSYAVQAYGNKSNSGIPSSFFYVIGQEDGTEFDFTPTVDILDSATGNLFTSSPTGGVKYAANNTYHIILNRGEVFNAMGSFVSKSGLDLSGTTVRSTNCKKIAVFGGNGRCLVDVGDGTTPTKYGTTGSDNLVQQMFPKVAWGKKYYTVPTKHMEYNTFRINVDDINTKVWVNDPTHTTPLTGLVNGYYEYYSNQPLVIESDKPISVTQFIVAQAYASGHPISGDPRTGFGSPSEFGMNGLGDPEMIILSPAQQAINKVTVYSPNFKNGNRNNTFTTTDGRTVVEAGGYINVVIPKTGLDGFKLDPETNLDQMVDTGSSSYNGIPFDSAAARIPIKKAFSPYPSDPNYYWAKFKVEYPAAHTMTSTVPFTAIAYGTDDGESYGFNAGTQVNDLTAPLILNNPYGDSLNSLNSAKPLTTCKGTDVALSATLPFANPEGHSITFSYGNNSNITPSADDVITNPVLDHTFDFNGQTFYVYKLAQKHSFSANGDYQINVTYFNPTPADGCGGQGGSNKTIQYTIKVVDGIAPAYTIDYNTCINSTVKITDQSNGLGYDIVKWTWSYDNGTKALPSGQDIVQNPTFANPANNTADNVKLLAINSIGCFGELQKALPVQSKPVITFNALPTGLCNTPTAAFELTAYANPAGGVFSGNGVELRSGKYWFNPAATAVSTTQANVITYNYTGGNSCVADPKTQNISVGQSTVLTLAQVSPLCINAAAVTLVTNNIAGGVLSGPGVSSGKFDPAVAGVGTHHITYAKTEDACSTPASIDIQVVGLPTVSFSNEFSPLCTNSPAITLNQGTPTGGTYSGAGVSLVDGAYKFDPSAQNVAINNVITYTATNSTGCSKSATNTIIVHPLPIVSAGSDLSVIQGTPITITGTCNTEAILEWSPTAGINPTNTLVTEALHDQIGEYIYRLTATVDNCSAFDEMKLTVRSKLKCLDPMKLFTPNGDGKNDKWLVFNDEGCFQSVQVDVYNRWGGLVYHADKYTNNWTGEFKGRTVPDATYYYIIKGIDALGRTQTASGNVTIMR